MPCSLLSNARSPADGVLSRPLSAKVSRASDSLVRKLVSAPVEAHCLYFIDRALSTFAKGSQPAYIQGLQDLQSKTQQLYPDSGKFSALPSEKQIKVLTAIENTPFRKLHLYKRQGSDMLAVLHVFERTQSPGQHQGRELVARQRRSPKAGTLSCAARAGPDCSKQGRPFAKPPPVRA